jgi:hypothetical protein
VNYEQYALNEREIADADDDNNNAPLCVSVMQKAK